MAARSCGFDPRLRHHSPAHVPACTSAALDGSGIIRPPGSCALTPTSAVLGGAHHVRVELSSGQRPAAAVRVGAVHVRALGALRLLVPWPVLRPVREHVRHRLPAGRGRTGVLGLLPLHARGGEPALPRLRDDRLERAPQPRTGDRIVGVHPGIEPASGAAPILPARAVASAPARSHPPANSPLGLVHQPAHLCVQAGRFGRASGRVRVLALDRPPGGKELGRCQRSGRRVDTTITMLATASRCSRSRFVA